MLKPSDISIIIPSLNCRALIDQLLPGALSLSNDVIVTDGGSTDGTQNTATALGATVIEAARGRGQQLASGAAMAQNKWLLFLHSDTKLPRSADRVMWEFIEAPENFRKAGYFALRFDDQSREGAFCIRHGKLAITNAWTSLWGSGATNKPRLLRGAWRVQVGSADGGRGLSPADRS